MNRNTNAEAIEKGAALRTDIGAKDYPGHGAWAMACKQVDDRTGWRHYYITENRAGAMSDLKRYPDLPSLLDAMTTLAPHDKWQIAD